MRNIFIDIVQFLIIKPIRYIALKMMKRLRRPDDMRAIIAASQNLILDIALPAVNSILQNKEFHEAVKFNKLQIAEQDRIFNELLVASMCLVLNCLEVAHSIVKPESLHFWIQTHKQFR
jgi:hypothetical protein